MHAYLVQRLRIPELYLYSPIRLRRMCLTAHRDNFTFITHGRGHVINKGDKLNFTQFASILTVDWGYLTISMASRAGIVAESVSVHVFYVFNFTEACLVLVECLATAECCFYTHQMREPTISGNPTLHRN
jgi:hypothetical protein